MSPFLECFVTRKACDMLSLAVEYDARLKGFSFQFTISAARSVLSSAENTF